VAGRSEERAVDGENISLWCATPAEDKGTMPEVGVTVVLLV
jgi:hypothetical protein